MSAAWMWGRTELRARWRSWVILGLLAGATFGLAAAGWAGARRTSVALPRYLAALRAPSAAILANDPVGFGPAERAKVAALPEVTATYPFLIGIGLEAKPAGLTDAIGLLPTTAGSARLLSEGVIVAGRFTDPKRADEVVVDENVRRKLHIGIGSTIELSQSASPQELAQIPPAMRPHGDPNFEQLLRVVGISKSVDSEPSSAPSAGFYAKYHDRLAGFINEFVTLRNGEAGIPKLDADVERIVGHPVNVESFSQLQGIPKIRNILRVEEQGLLLFALAVLVVGGVLVGQALARAVSAGAADMPTWRAIGADRSIAIRALTLPALVSAGAGVLVAVAVAIGLSERFPISQARRFDLDVGYHADWLVLGLMIAAVLVAVLAIAIVAALWAVSGRRTVRHSPSTVGRWTARAGLPPALAIGSRLAVEPGRGRRAVPVRSALIGAIVGVLGVVGCFTFRAGLADAAASPQRSGITWDYEFGSGVGQVPAPKVAAIAKDSDVASFMHGVWVRNVRIDGVGTPTWATETVKGEMSPVVLSGRAPRTRDEIAFGPGTMKDLHAHIGEHIAIGPSDGHTVKVVGTALLPASSHTDYDVSGWMTMPGIESVVGPLAKLDVNTFEDYGFVKWKPHVNVKHAQAGVLKILGDDLGDAAPATLPTAVVSLGHLESLPFALGIFFALLATATVAHALVTTVRRRRHELAVLRSLGFTRRQTRGAIAWQATLIAAAGLIVGVPLGILAGRALWRHLAENFPLAYVPPLALLAVLLVVPAAILLANVLAAVPARSAARIRPAEALRTE